MELLCDILIGATVVELLGISIFIYKQQSKKIQIILINLFTTVAALVYNLNGFLHPYMAVAIIVIIITIIIDLFYLFRKFILHDETV